ncbi:MAG: DegT/DnrJ/EryC1/StrS family aminotransferase [Labilithrix sp.]|nr:DegT/DnrJ/EryC1/StrS family aminotransferase [Labilithrix sp.]
MNIPVTKTVLGEEEIKAVAERLLGGWVVQGPKVREFEELFAAYAGTRFARATTSCTTALHLGLLTLGVGPGDEVIVPAFTYVASANAVVYCGATPVFVDIDLSTFDVDVSKIEAKITPKTKAIMPVHEFGLAADMDAILAIAKRHDIPVIEDGACATGTRYHGKHVGGFGKVGCFSFHPRKAITSGEGGMITTDDEAIATRLEVLRSHGASMSDLARHEKGGASFALPEFDELGFNYRMTDIQAAIGVEQMKKLPWILSARQARAKRFNELLAGIPGLTLPRTPEGYEHAFQSYVAIVEKSHEDRDRIALALQAKGIATRQGTHAVHALGYYRAKYGTKIEDCPMAWKADRQSMTLPLYATMTDEEQDYVVRCVRETMAS